MDPLFSIAIPTYNRAELLDFCLSRLPVLDRFGKPFEIVVSDNASTDATPQVIAAWRERLPYLRACRFEKNMGVYSSWANALRNGKGRFLVFLADDDSIIAENLIPYIERMEREPNLAAIYTDWIAYDDRNEQELHRYFEFTQPMIFAPNNPLGLVNFVLQNIVYPEIGIYRRDALMSAQCLQKHTFPFFLTMYRLLRHGHLAFELTPFYRETRVLKGQLQRQYWSNMDLHHYYVSDDLRLTLETMLLLALQDAGAPRVPDEQVGSAKYLIDRIMHARLPTMIQRAAAGKDWISAVEYRRRMLLWQGPGSPEEQQRETWLFAFPAALQAVQETVRQLTDVSGLWLRGFHSPQIATFYRTHYPDLRLIESEEQAFAVTGKLPVVLWKTDQEPAPATQHVTLPGYTFYLNRLLDNYRVTIASYNLAAL